ncbi:MAG: hypothetical protein A2381_00370 [Bdellovibrionales bacterium RIFOXYB1_FULL_37_110]|nr:MAG: hypothetical protein A2417_11425 [Bdellovibrionales bacterium RIFOXYC1_FULL_37_79]OFZ60848.1 MAG: hypothetical protein A2381_00370 [Bdellovibrionales bacterium RIFOXYB1_FULL_37_110]OFZ62378.1 MAG: hypothetical protein A2577_03035 [Bdellovibrionales bacterium RIFOXYD1_FULL_36_51]
MKKSLVLLSFITLTSTAFAGGGTIIKCTMESMQSPKITTSASLNLSKINGDDVATSENEIQVGEDKYSFDFYVSQEDTTKTINVIFYENVNVQDQVGEISCVYEPQNITSKFCEDNLFDDNGTHILSFSCEAIVPLF